MLCAAIRRLLATGGCFVHAFASGDRFDVAPELLKHGDFELVREWQHAPTQQSPDQPTEVDGPGATAVCRCRSHPNAAADEETCAAAFGELQTRSFTLQQFRRRRSCEADES